MKRYEIATAAVIMVIAAVAMFDTSKGALPDPSGTAPGGLRTGFYPFWSASLVFVGAALIAWRARRAELPARGVFTERKSLVTLFVMVVPIVIAVASLKWLGFYLMTALYMGFFARAIGRYKWHWTALAAIVPPLLIYLAFEYGFRVGLPKSIFYDAVRF